MRDIRECYVWLEYTDGFKLRVEMMLDIDECVEEQIRRSWDSPQSLHETTGRPIAPCKLVNFKWDLIDRYQTIHNEEYS